MRPPPPALRARSYSRARARLNDKVLVASGRQMAQPENYRALALWEPDRTLAIGFAVRFSVAVKGSGTVLLVDHDQVQPLIGLFLRC